LEQRPSHYTISLGSRANSGRERLKGEGEGKRGKGEKGKRGKGEKGKRGKANCLSFKKI
jgi:hypothetical protein